MKNSQLRGKLDDVSPELFVEPPAHMATSELGYLDVALNIGIFHFLSD
jgi:hypothetical protein